MFSDSNVMCSNVTMADIMKTGRLSEQSEPKLSLQRTETELSTTSCTSAYADKRAKSKAPNFLAMDLPLCSVMRGSGGDADLWFVGDMRTRTGGLAKCWKRLNLLAYFEEIGVSMLNLPLNDDGSMSLPILDGDELGELAKMELAKSRKKIAELNPDMISQFVSVDDDAEFFENLEKEGGIMPSKARSRAKEAKRNRGGENKRESGGSNGSMGVRKLYGKTTKKIARQLSREAEEQAKMRAAALVAAM